MFMKCKETMIMVSFVRGNLRGSGDYYSFGKLYSFNSTFFTEYAPK